MSGSNYTTTPNLGLFKPNYAADFGQWGTHLNANSDVLDQLPTQSGNDGRYLQLSGGTMSGPINSPGTITTTSAGTPAISTSWTYPGNTGSTNTVQVQTANNMTITGATGTSIWANRDIVTYNSPTPATGQPSYVARTIHTIANTDRGSAFGVAPTLFGAIIDVIDNTGHASSVAGNLMALEVDVEAGGADDARQRQGVVVSIMNRNYPTTATCEVARGVYVTADPNSTMIFPIQIDPKYSGAAIDLHFATPVGNAPAIWMGDTQRISFDTAENTGLGWNTGGSGSTIAFTWSGTPIWTLNPSGGTVQQGALTATGPGTFSNPLTVQNTTGGAALNLNGTAGNGRSVQMLTGGNMRWRTWANTTAEGGTATGSDLTIDRFDNSGNFLGSPIIITRSTGVVTFAQSPTAPTMAYGDATTALATDAFVQAAVAPIANDVGRNRIHNPGFGVNQRAYASGTALAAAAYGHDRWKAGSGGCTYTFTQTQPTTTITITAGTLQQIVEAQAVAGGTYTLSWTGTAQGRINAGSYAASPLTVAGLAANTAITVEFNAGTVGQVQLEAGSVRTAFSQLDPALQLMQCQRFYQIGSAQLVGYQGAAAGQAGYIASLPVTMRATPNMAVLTTIANNNASAQSITGMDVASYQLYLNATAAGSFNYRITWSASADL